MIDMRRQEVKNKTRKWCSLCSLSSLDGKPLRDVPTFSISLLSLLSQSQRSFFVGSSLLSHSGACSILYVKFLPCLFTDVTDTSGDVVEVKVSQEELIQCEALE